VKPESCTDKVLLISGGSRGLGGAIVSRWLEAGARVATFARRGTKLVEDLAARWPDRLLFRPIDATHTAEVDAFVSEAHARFGRIDFLVNNAAMGQDHLLAHMSPELVRQVTETNVVAPILLTRLVVRIMLVQGAGRIVNISSICGSRGFPGLSVYSASKGAMDAFTRSLARELGARGILVNSIAPGFFASEMSSVLSSEQLESIRRRTPTGRLVEEEEILPLVDTLLLGPSSITGQTICVDGGATL
jgi:3-oxoacyl-[acyl-carrier protein] reductase